MYPIFCNVDDDGVVFDCTSLEFSKEEITNRFAWVLIGIFASGAIARGAQYEIPLPGLTGVYSTGDIAPGGRQPFAIDCSGFTQIDAVYLEITGNVSPASVHYSFDNVQEYPLLHFNLGNSAEDWMSFQPDATLALVEKGSFHVREVFAAPRGGEAEFSFLLDGQGMMSFGVLSVHYLGGFSKEELIPATVNITGARLIIEGTPAVLEGPSVPEPTSALLILPASLILTRRARRQMR